MTFLTGNASHFLDPSRVLLVGVQVDQNICSSRDKLDDMCQLCQDIFPCRDFDVQNAPSHFLTT